MSEFTIIPVIEKPRACFSFVAPQIPRMSPMSGAIDMTKPNPGYSQKDSSKIETIPMIMFAPLSPFFGGAGNGYPTAA